MDYEKSFKNWYAEEVEKAFGIRRTWESEALDRWLSAELDIPEDDAKELSELSRTARFRIDAWNEAALKFLLIAPLVRLVDFTSSASYAPFLEQTLTIENGTNVARGNIDFMVATGRRYPEAPFYLLHEYKPESSTVLDPQGQLIIAMLAAQRANQGVASDHPVYGSYVLGRLWFMVIMEGETYTISEGFDSTKEEGIRAIYRALAVVKRTVEVIVEARLSS